MAQEVVNPEEQVYMLCKFQLYKIRLCLFGFFTRFLFLLSNYVCVISNLYLWLDLPQLAPK
jgi:hypothetical protein